MPKQTVEAMVEGGKASAAPPLGPALGPLGVNIGLVIKAINDKTSAFKGIQVPIKVVVSEDKTFEIEVGTPPTSALLKQEAKLTKGSGSAKDDLVADLKIEQVIKVVKMKGDDLLGREMVSRVKEVIGTCVSMGVMIEGKRATESMRDIEKGAFAEQIKSGKTELTAEELKALETKKKALAAEIERRKTEFTTLANQILEQLKGQTRAQIKAKMVEAKIPTVIIDELLPVEKKVEEGAKPAAPAKK